MYLNGIKLMMLAIVALVIRICRKHCIGFQWLMTQMAKDHLGRSQMANGGLLRPEMSPGLNKSPPWSTHSI